MTKTLIFDQREIVVTNWEDGHPLAGEGTAPPTLPVDHVLFRCGEELPAGAEFSIKNESLAGIVVVPPEGLPIGSGCQVARVFAALP